MIKYIYQRFILKIIKPKNVKHLQQNSKKHRIVEWSVQRPIIKLYICDRKAKHPTKISKSYA